MSESTGNQHITKHKQTSSTQKALNVWGIVLATWAIYRSTIGATAPIFFDEVLLKPLLFIGPVLWYITIIEKKTFLQGIWFQVNDWKKDGLVALLISLPIVLLLAYSLFFPGFTVTGPKLVLFSLVALGMTFSEEILSRGFVARHIWEEKKNIIITVAQANALHLFLRIPRMMTTPELFGQKLFAFAIAEVTLSVVLTTLFIWRRNLLPVLIVRYLYTLTLMSLLM